MMKKVILLLLVLCSFLYGAATVEYRLLPYGIIKGIVSKKAEMNSKTIKYKYKKSFFEQEYVDDFDVVFIGDSITGWAHWNELFPTLLTANRGIGGDTTDGVIDRIDSIVNTKAKKAFIMIGINDILNGKEISFIVTNYKIIIESLLESGMDVYVQSTLITQRRDVNLKVRELNLILRSLSKQLGVKYFDINLGLSNEGVLSPKYTIDGIHLNGAGYTKWKKKIESYVNFSYK
ncbi:hypothetical protein BIT28_06815 [Photobacterium proteolyticum]|uniref:SGNH hydrolase-type esterase domain-containing protein n=1 Tax=Photobacterium proteolyticum TaxID=1903952 RepID=A0A1Q9GER8_9GAMM|nr:GDSL-type esterase/lipase family protein [Photobacterium proteolyticum]OLQ72890.1 hypothetical protein BIT28_06815 [Photobacterium proteolyticum]